MTYRLLAPATALLVACSPPAGPGPVVPKSPVERKMIGLLEKFDRWDDDGSGELDRAELAAGLAGTEHQPDRVIAFYDINGNGRISLREAQAGFARAEEAEKLAASRQSNP